MQRYALQRRQCKRNGSRGGKRGTAPAPEVGSGGWEPPAAPLAARPRPALPWHRSAGGSWSAPPPGPWSGRTTPCPGTGPRRPAAARCGARPAPPPPSPLSAPRRRSSPPPPPPPRTSASPRPAPPPARARRWCAAGSAAAPPPRTAPPPPCTATARPPAPPCRGGGGGGGGSAPLRGTGRGGRLREGRRDGEQGEPPGNPRKAAPGSQAARSEGPRRPSGAETAGASRLPGVGEGSAGAAARALFAGAPGRQRWPPVLGALRASAPPRPRPVPSFCRAQLPQGCRRAFRRLREVKRDENWASSERTNSNAYRKPWWMFSTLKGVSKPSHENVWFKGSTQPLSSSFSKYA